MTSVEKRRSRRKSGSHRKHSDGGFSDTSSGGSFLDETDREVSSLTDRAFRSLCIGDEAVYNDSDLTSSPCTQKDRQLAFSHGVQDREDREREELKRTAHESFSFRVQQYGQDWIHGGMYGAEIQRDPQWDVYGEKTQGRVSATFQQSFGEMSQQEKFLKEEQLSFFSNGATELGSQQRRSRSRVSSLIKAFNSEGVKDGSGMDGKLREWNDDTSWDKSALMSIQRELSEFSSYPQNLNSGHFPPAHPFSGQDPNYYSNEVAAMAHMNATSSFMRSSHSKHSMFTQVNCNSNFFIHSEFSPFKVWRDHNRFPFQQGEVSGFMHCSDFPKWCETPMYKELSLEAQPKGPSMFQDRGFRHHRNKAAPVAPSPQRSTSTSTMLQKASPLEKRCESELAGHYPHRMRTQSLGTNRLPAQRPSTASPTIEMSRRVRDTISSVKALQQKIKMMTEENNVTGITTDNRFYGNENMIPYGYNTATVAHNTVSTKTSTTPFNAHPVHSYQEVETSEVQCAISPQPVEHAPVRAESRGATPDVRISSYKSRATSLLFNLKDNRKRVKSTYSPTKFKGFETMDKSKQPPVQECRDTVIDIPEFLDTEIQNPQIEESNWTDITSQQYLQQYQCPGLALAAINSQPATAYPGHNSEYTSYEYPAAQLQGEMVHHPGFTGFMPGNYSTNQLANGQHPQENVPSFTPYKQGVMENVGTVGGDVYRQKPSYRAAETQMINSANNQVKDYLISKENTQHVNETMESQTTKVGRYQQLKENKYDYSNVSLQDRWRQNNTQDTEKIGLNAAITPWKQEISTLMEKDQQAQAYQNAVPIMEELTSPVDKYRIENQQNINKEPKTMPQYAPPYNGSMQNTAYYGQQQEGEFRDKYLMPNYFAQDEKNGIKDNYSIHNYNRYTDQEYRNKHAVYENEDKTMLKQETGQRKEHSPVLWEEGHNRSLKEAEQQLENRAQKSITASDKASAIARPKHLKDKQFAEVKAAPDMVQIQAQHTQAELAEDQQWAKVEQPKAESAKLILAGQTGPEKVKTELTEFDTVKQAETKMTDVSKAEYNEVEWQTKDQERETKTGEKHSQQNKTASQVQNLTEKPRKTTEEKQKKEEQSQIQQEEKVKEGNIKTELANSEQVRIEQAETQPSLIGRVKTEQPQAEVVQRQPIRVEQIQNEHVKIDEIEHKKAEQAKLQQMKGEEAKSGQEKRQGDVKIKQGEEDSIKAAQVNVEQQKTEPKAKEPNAELSKPEHTQFEQNNTEVGKVELAKTGSLLESKAKPTTKLAQHDKSGPNKPEQGRTELAQWHTMEGSSAKPTTKLATSPQDRCEANEVAQVKTDVAKPESTQERTTKPAAKLTLSQQCQIEPNMVEQVKKEQAKAELAQPENIQEKASKTTPKLALSHQDRDKTELAKTELSKVESRPKISVKPSTNLSMPLQGKHELYKAEQTKLDLVKTDLAKTESIREALAKSTAKPGMSQVKSAPNKVEQVKTELAKAKAELAKIKEKMREDQKDKVRNAVKTKEDVVTKKDVPLGTNLNQGKENEGQAPQTYQQKENSTVSKYRDQADRGANDYESLREKYGFTHPILSPKNKTSPTGHVSPDDGTSASKLNEVEKRQLTDSQYVYSESSKEFKLSNTDVLPARADKRTDNEAVAVKAKDVTAEKLDECNPPKTDVSQQRDAKPTERKPKSSEQNVVLGKDPHFIPPRSLSHKERAQTKQEILTSKIKAHAEKEISAIKEGFAIRDGLLSKNPSKQVFGNPHVRQRPPSQDSSKRQESKMPINTIPKHHTGPMGVEAAKSITVQSSTATANQTLDYSQKPVPKKEPTKTNYQSAPESLVEKKESRSNPNSTGGGMTVSHKTDNQPELKPPTQNIEPVLKSDKGSQGAQHGENSEKLKKDLVNKTPVNTDELHKKNDPSQVLSKHEDNLDDTSPSLRLGLGQNETSVADNSLQIMGIMVSVRERDMSTHDQSHTNDKESGKAEPDKHHPNSVPAVSKEKESLTNETGRLMDKVEKETQPKVKQSKNGPINPENLPQTSATERSKDNVTEKVTTGPQREIQLQEPLVGKDVPFTATVPSKNREPVETQPLFYKQKIIAKETKDHSNKMSLEDTAKALAADQGKTKPTGHISEKFEATEENVKNTQNEDSNGAVAQTQPPVKEDIATAINPSESSNKSVPLVEENNDVHIDCIAIRVVPAVSEQDNIKISGKADKTPHSDVVVAEKPNATSSRPDESASHKEDPTPTKHEKGTKDKLEEKLGVQYVLSSVRKLANSRKNSNEHHSVNELQADSGKPEKMQNNDVQPNEGDYFQVQGGIQKSTVPYNNSTDVGDRSDAVSKERELPELLPMKAAISNESYREGKQLARDQSKRKTGESSLVSVQDEIIKSHTREIGDKTGLKQTNCPTEIQSSNSEKMEALHNRKQHSASRSRSLSRERHRTRNSQATRKEVKAEPEVKSKSKERVSTIPEISALADYARLKVIVSEDQENTIQEFPPNKKEGFFPLIQSRHSKRPVFTADPPDLTVKDKSVPTKTEASSKVNKEPKPVVFPITEKQHQRTGMFKLGDKERQEKMPDVKGNKTQDLTGIKNSSQGHNVIQDSGEESRAGRGDPTNQKPNNHLMQEAKLAINQSRSTSVSQQQKIMDDSNQEEKPGQSYPPEGMPYLDRVSHPQPTLGSMSTNENLDQRDRVVDEDAAFKSRDNRLEKSSQERLGTLSEESKAKPQSTAKQLDEEQKKENREDGMKIKHMIEESRASWTEEERKAAQREEERRAREREAIATEIKRKREKQKEAEERKAKLMEEKRAAQEEEERRAKQRQEEARLREMEEQRRVKAEEERREKLRAEEERMKEIEARRIKQREEEKAAQEEQQRRAALFEEQRRAQQVEEERRLAQIAEEKRIKQIREQEIEKQRRERQKKEEWMRAQREDEERRIAEKAAEKAREQQAREERARLLEAQTEEIRAKRREDRLAAQREEEKASRMEEQKRAAQRVDAPQYYAFTSGESERKPRERPSQSPLPVQRRDHPPESTEESVSHRRPHRPQSAISPAPSLPRSNTSSPAPGPKPSMFRVKDNTIRGSIFTKSVKPRFHKSFGEDFRVGSPMGSDRGEEEQEMMRRNAGTPVHPDSGVGLNRLAAIKESSAYQSASDHSTPIPHYRPYSRRSLALDEEDSRSVVSNMSEDVESFATSAADLADIRGLYDYDRPESACSFSSDVSRALGKPPAVPPKSDKALRRAKRLTTRRIKKELSKVATDSHAEKPFQEISGVPSSSSTEVCSSDSHAVASPHFSSPVSLTHAPTLQAGLPSSHTGHQLSRRSCTASPHATAPVSLPVASPHATAPMSLPVASPPATAPVSLPVASPHATAPVSLPVASPPAIVPVSLPVASPHATAPISLPVALPHASDHITHPSHKTVPHVPSSPTLHRANHPAPVTQYQVESSYPQSYPLTQRKVLQDPGSGQYFVVDAPVQVKTKTFFDPETGKYVQLNVRESGQSISRPHSHQLYPQPRLQPQHQFKQQQQLHSQASPSDKPFALHQGYHNHPQAYQHAGVSPVHPQRPPSSTSIPGSLPQEQQSFRESHSHRYQNHEHNSEGHRYSPEHTPYMDTVNDKDKTYNPVYNTHGSHESFPECDTNSQLAGSTVCDNDNSAHSSCLPRDIITIGELEDFMEISDW